jgi:hypothetical protein
LIVSRRAHDRDGEEHIASKIWRNLWGGFGLLVALGCAMMLAIAASSLITGEDPETERSTLVGLVVLFTGGTLWGLNIARQSFGWRLPGRDLLHLVRRPARDKRQEVLSYATSGGGRVTVVEVAGRCQLTVEESEAILNDFAAREVAELLVAEDGTVVYDFNLLSNKEKARAKELS